MIKLDTASVPEAAGGAGTAAGATELILVENWFEELKRLAPAGT